MIKITKRDLVTPLLNRQIREISRVPAESARVFRDNTPKKTGRARRNTRLVGDTIRADYPYAVALDQGRSAQAPRGMVQPTIDWIRNRLNKIFRG